MYQIAPEPVKQRNLRLSTTCPECGLDIEFNRAPALQEIIYCIECDTNLEVIVNYPLKLDWYFEEAFDNETFDNEMESDDGPFWEDDSWDDMWEN